MSKRILIVDDEPSKIKLLETALRRSDFTDISSTTDARRALPVFREFKPDVLLIDLLMPQLDGLTIMQQLLSRLEQREYLPIIITTPNLTPEMRRRALEHGAKDFLPEPFDPDELPLRIRNLLQVRELNAQLETRVKSRTAQLEAAEVEIAKRLAFAAELRDYPDGSHPSRVGRMSAAIAAELGLTDAEVELIRLAAPLHDIGKLCIPDAVLLKPSALTAAEMEIIKQHTTQGAKMLTGTQSDILQAAEEIALYHHENWDGTGYTPGLAGETIPLPGRIVTVADVFDALLHKRAYKPAWSSADAVIFIEQQKGKKFDPAVVEAFRRVADIEFATAGAEEWEDFMSSVSGSFADLVNRALAD
jgi:putative two-component system response regulator